MGGQTLDPEELSRSLEKTAERFGQLIEKALQSGETPTAWDRDFLAELATGMEELRVAEEELIVQAEQLAGSHRMIDSERERYADLFDFAPDGYIETDDLGKIMEANVAATRLLGVPARFMTGKLLYPFVAAEDRRMVRSLLADLARDAGVQTVTVRIEPRNAEPLWVEMRIGGHYDPVEDTHRIRWLIRDVSERMKLLQELSELHVSVDLLTALSEVNRLIEGEEDALSSLLVRLVELAHRVTNADAGIMLVGDDATVTLRAVAGAGAADLCQEQLVSGGPAVETQRDGRTRVVPVGELVEWPDLARKAMTHAIQEVIAEPIHIDGTVRGTINLYVRGELADGEHLARLLADSAAAAISNAQVYAGARNLAGHLSSALESRGVIEQAKGILMAMQRCSPDQAFDILRRSSQRQNRKLRTIAEEIVERFSGPAGAPGG